MAIEPVGSTAMSYQSMASNETMKPVQESRDAQVQESVVAQEAATKMTDFTVQSESNAGQSQDEETKNSQEQNEKLRKSVEQLNKQIGHQHVEAQFGIHEKTNRVTIKIVDKDTNEVIREVPPEKTLDMIAKAWELAGLLVDEKR